MSEYMCDICSKTLARSEIKAHTPATIHRAIRKGLNPWKTHGIDMSVSARISAAFGINSDEQYAHWRQRALADTTDWGLCPTCTQAVGRVNIASTIYRIIALCAGTGEVFILLLGPGFASDKVLGLLPLGILGGYAAIRLNRLGVLWGVFGTVFLGVPFFLLSVLPLSDWERSWLPLSSRIPPWVVMPPALALSLFAVWFSTSDFAHWTDAQHWDCVSSYEAYLAQRPNGLHAGEAEAHLAKLRPKKDRLEAWLKQIRESPNYGDVFSSGHKNDEVFKPKYFIVSLGWQELDIPDQGRLHDGLVETVENAQTVVLVRIRSISSHGDDLLTVCLVDSENTQRRRVIQASTSYSGASGGVHEIEGVTYAKGISVPDLLAASLEKAAK